MAFRSVICGLALTALVSGVAGCGDDKTNFAATTSSDNGQKIRVIGRVMNAQTFAPVVNAQVVICGITFGFTDAGGTFVIDIPKNITDNTDGDFSTSISMRVTAGGMATQFFSQDFDNDESEQSSGSGEVDPGTSSLSYMDIGTIELNTGFTQSIVVTKDGAPLKRAAVAVYADNEDYDTQFNGSGEYTGYSTCLETQNGTTNENGVVAFGNLDPFRRYNVVVPSQDLDGVIGFDFPTEDESFTVQGSGAVYALDVDGTRFFDGNVSVTDDSDRQFADISVNRGVISSVTSSGTILLNTISAGVQTTATALNFSSSNINGRAGLASVVDGAFSGEDYVTSANGAVSMVFQTPVTVVQGTAGREVSFRYFDNMIDPANTATFNKLNVITGTATSLTTALGTIWSFTPNASMPAYTPYTIEFFARSTADSNIASAIGREYMRIPTGLSATINVTADNYNGTTNGDGGLGAAMFFDFDRIVRGTIQIIEVTNENVLSSFGSGSGTFRVEDRANTIVNNITAATGTDIGDLGATAGLRYRVNSFQSNVADNRAGFANSVRAGFAVEDIDGNKLETILNLPVR